MGVTSNPYLAGDPVGKHPSFVGREDVLREVLRVLHHPQQNAITLYGQRRIGKTSILQYLETHLSAEGIYHPALFDLMGYAARPLDDVLDSLAEKIAQTLGQPKPNLGKKPRQTFGESWLPSVLQTLPAETRLVLLMDEFDVQADVQTDHQTKQDFFTYLRNLRRIEPSRLKFVFVLGRAIDDLDIIAQGLLKDLPSYRVSLLKRKEAETLIRLSERQGTLSWSQEAVERVWDLTHGHPLLVQSLCSEIWERTQEEGKTETVDASWVDEAVPPALERSTNMFSWLWQGLSAAEKVVSAALAAAGHKPVNDDVLRDILTESGVSIVIRELADAPKLLQERDILEPSDGGYRFRVELLRRWIAENKPLSRTQSELDRINPAADNLYQAGRSFFENGNLSDAFDLLERSLRLNPNHLGALELMGEIYLTQGNLDAAQETLEKLLEMAPGRARARLKQVYIQRAQSTEDDRNKLIWYEKILSIYPQDIDGLRGKETVEVRLRRRRLESGQQEIEKLEKEGNFLAALEKAQALWHEFPEEDSLLEWTKRLERKTHLDDLYQQAIQELEKGERENAIRTLQEIVALEPSYRQGDAIAELYHVVTGKSIEPMKSQSTSPGVPPIPISPAVLKKDEATQLELPKVPAGWSGPVPPGAFARIGKGRISGNVVFSPDSKLLALGCSIGIYLYSTVDETIWYLATQTPVTSLAFSPDGMSLALGLGNTVRLWNYKKGTFLHTFEGRKESIACITFSPDGSILASGSRDHTLQLWHVTDGKLLHRLEGHADWVTSVAFSPDGILLASASADRTIRLWRTSDGALIRTLSGHTQSVTSLAFSPDGKILVSGSTENNLMVWYVSDGSFLNTLKGHDGPVNSVAFSPSGILASGSNDCTVRLWNIQDGKLLHTLEGHTDWVTGVVFSPDGKLLASLSADKTVRLWQTSDGLLVRTLGGHMRHVTSLSFSPDGAILASGSSDKTVRLWRISDETLLFTLEGHKDDINSVAFSPEGKILASGGGDKTIRLWRVLDGMLLHTFKEHDSVNIIAFSPDGRLLASGSRENTVRLWRLSDGALLRTLHTFAVTGLVFSPDGKILVSVSIDGTVWFWRTSDGSLLHMLKSKDWITSVAFSPDGKIVAFGSGDHTVQVWRVLDGALLHSLKLSEHMLNVTSLAFSPNKEILASGSRDKTVRLWQVSDGRLLRTLEGHKDNVRSIAFSPDGAILASGSDDGTILLWRIDNG